MTVARFFHAGPHQPPWDGASHQPRANMRTVMTKKGQVSTCNAGARASPADVPPRTPSKPGTTHHQGSGNTPLSSPTKGFSMCSNFIDFIACMSVPRPPLVIHQRPGHVDGGVGPSNLEGGGSGPPTAQSVFSISVFKTSYDVAPASR